MDDCETYLNWDDWIIPILVVLITGILAFWQLRYQNKQARIDRWKEEFRNYSAEYIELTSHFSINIKHFLNQDYTKDTWSNLMVQNVKFRGVSTKIELLVDGGNPYYKELMECIHRQGQCFIEALNNKEHDGCNKVIIDFQTLVKKIHRDYKG